MIAGLFAKRKYYDPIQQLEKAKATEEEMINSENLKTEIIIFQTSLSRQSLAIQIATKSEYSHCGLIFIEGKEISVLEALQREKYAS